jgi:hypothetical protein
MISLGASDACATANLLLLRPPRKSPSKLKSGEGERANNGHTNQINSLVVTFFLILAGVGRCSNQQQMKHSNKKGNKESRKKLSKTFFLMGRDLDDTKFVVVLLVDPGDAANGVLRMEEVAEG